MYDKISSAMNMDLWATLDNQQAKQDQASEAGELAKQGQTRRLTEAAVLSMVRAWLLRDYLAPYCRSLASIRIFRRCYWIDGPGVEKRARVTESLVEAGRGLAEASRPIALRGLVLKAGSSRRRQGTAGKEAVVKLPESGGLVDASWQEAQAALLLAIEQAPAVFLLNPFGQTLFGYDDLAPLYQRTGPTELFLLLSHKHLGSHLLAASEPGAANGAALTNLLRSDRWKSLLANPHTATNNADEHSRGNNTSGLLRGGQSEIAPPSPLLPTQAIDGLIDLLMASMKARFLTVQRIALPVQVGAAAIELAPCTLLFATRRQDSLAIMNDAVCAYRRRVSAQSYQGVLGEEWFAQQERERLAAEQQELEQFVSAQGMAQRPRRWPELRQRLLLTRFGRWPLQEYDAVMCRLLQNGVARCEWRRKLTTDSTDEKPVPGDEDILFWIGSKRE